MDRSTLAGSCLVVATFVGAQPAECQTYRGDQAPMYQAVDENMRLVDMADFIDGTPLLFLYTSAT